MRPRIVKQHKLKELIGKKVYSFLGVCQGCDLEIMESWVEYFKRKGVPFFMLCLRTKRKGLAGNRRPCMYNHSRYSLIKAVEVEETQSPLKGWVFDGTMPEWEEVH